MLLVTYGCNLHCAYCYEPKTEHKQMSVSMAKKILKEQLLALDDKYDTVEVHYMGGEPLLEFPLIVEVSEWLWTLDFVVGKKIMCFAPTNGTLLTNQMKDWFYANKHRISLGLSFDGDRVMQNMNRCNSSKSVDLAYFVNTWPKQSVKMTASPETVDRLFTGVEFLQDVGFKYVSVDLAMGDSVRWTADGLLELKKQLSRFVTYYTENPDAPRCSMFFIDITSVLHADRNVDVKTCGCGETLNCFDCNGKKYGCHLFAPISIDVAKAKKSQETIDFSNHKQFQSVKCKKCILNTLCNHCYGMNYITTGDVSQPLSFHCSAFKLIFVANCRLQLNLAKRFNDIDYLKKINKIIIDSF